MDGSKILKRTQCILGSIMMLEVISCVSMGLLISGVIEQSHGDDTIFTKEIIGIASIVVSVCLLISIGFVISVFRGFLLERNLWKAASSPKDTNFTGVIVTRVVLILVNFIGLIFTAAVVANFAFALPLVTFVIGGVWFARMLLGSLRAMTKQRNDKQDVMSDTALENAEKKMSKHFEKISDLAMQLKDLNSNTEEYKEKLRELKDLNDRFARIGTSVAQSRRNSFSKTTTQSSNGSFSQMALESQQLDVSDPRDMEKLRSMIAQTHGGRNRSVEVRLPAPIEPSDSSLERFHSSPIILQKKQKLTTLSPREERPAQFVFEV
jgi:hypothetical protein